MLDKFAGLLDIKKFISYMTGLPELNQYYAAHKVSCSITQHSDSISSESQLHSQIH